LVRNLGFSPVELRGIQRILKENESSLLENGMQGSEVRTGERVKGVHVTEDTLTVDLIDGRTSTIIVPLAWYPKLLDATPEERRNLQISGAGYGIHWPDVDEDLSTEGLLRGAPAAREPAQTRASRGAKQLRRKFL
jgi:hypothetical protein